eukprot:CAMPEP_0184374956 /NCGR_PEP_ID=MMETSP1089-20130417/165300_1 /TAXON_ID=38269 ORGANISM="Gloeochaete wittrockiana, Strain SAG46.84" /NCGR_SAMPLE_ID=MMETSP1089 /ASSEMBLY_ACC=CAM_ASM_000445 /LENGTH=117 /DNA_ID=CAMNT_0026717997 /DNA_START=279 /DNA_END=632 /DNA_ORIENTATION=+
MKPVPPNVCSKLLGLDELAPGVGARLYKLPGSTSRSTYSAATMPSRKDAGVRFRVDNTIPPAGCTKELRESTNAPGSFTCSTTSIQTTASKSCFSIARSSAVQFRYVSDWSAGSSDA